MTVRLKVKIRQIARVRVRIGKVSLIPESRELISLQVYEPSPEERSVCDSLAGRISQLFLILREWASVHAGRGSSKFPVSREFLAKRLNCTGMNITLMLQKLVELGVIQKAEEHNYREKRSAMYSWELPTTIPIPCAPKPESDSGEESVF